MFEDSFLFYSGGSGRIDVPLASRGQSQDAANTLWGTGRPTWGKDPAQMCLPSGEPVSRCLMTTDG